LYFSYDKRLCPRFISLMCSFYGIRKFCQFRKLGKLPREPAFGGRVPLPQRNVTRSIEMFVAARRRATGADAVGFGEPDRHKLMQK
jgi:hypothetical protein